jgi:hypothetical protein
MSNVSTLYSMSNGSKRLHVLPWFTRRYLVFCPGLWQVSLPKPRLRCMIILEPIRSAWQFLIALPSRMGAGITGCVRLIRRILDGSRVIMGPTHLAPGALSPQGIVGSLHLINRRGEL